MLEITKTTKHIPVSDPGSAVRCGLCYRLASGDREEHKKARYKLQKSLSKAKRWYSFKLPSPLHHCRDTAHVSGPAARYGAEPESTATDTSLPDELNEFYARF